MKAWSIDETKALLRVARKNDPQFYVLLLICMCHGLRVSEAVSLRKRDFVVIGGRMKIRVQRLKGSLETEQRLHHDEDELLDEDFVVRRYISKIGTDDFLFPRPKTEGGTEYSGKLKGWARNLDQDETQHLSRFQADRKVARYCAMAGIDSTRAHMHCAKHTLGVLMRKAGRPIEEIAQALGHKNINNAKVYMNVTDEEADFARDAAFAAAAGGK